MSPDLVVDIVVESFKLIEPSSSVASAAPILDAVLAHTGINQISSMAPHFVYTIRIKMRSPDVKEWIIKKRFSELAKLDRDLSDMTRNLAAFPPRGARRDLSDDCALRRLHGLNHYFSVLCQMPEIVMTKTFMLFFDFDSRYHSLFLPRCVAEIHPVRAGDQRSLRDSELCISSISAKDDFLMTTLSTRSSLSTKLGRFLSSFISRSATSDTSQIILWRRLPNSYLFEKASHIHNITARITVSFILSLEPVLAVFGCSDGRLGTIVNDRSRSSSDEPYSISFISTGITPDCTVSSACIDTTADNRAGFWAAWADGSIRLLVLSDESEWKLEYRISEIWSAANEQVFATSMISSGPILFCGLSNGLVSVITRSGGEYRQVTILQGPPTFITSLSLSADVLYATHSCGLMDSVEGSNSVQPWRVSHILTRGTEKLDPWGPLTASCVSSSAISESLLAVASSRGTIYVLKSTKCIHMFGVDAISSLEHGCLSRFPGDDTVVFVACENLVKVFQLPTYSDHDRYVDISYLDVCQSDQLPEAATPIETEISRKESEDDDLHSWARDL